MNANQSTLDCQAEYRVPFELSRLNHPAGVIIMKKVLMNVNIRYNESREFCRHRHFADYSAASRGSLFRYQLPGLRHLPVAININATSVHPGEPFH